MLRFHQSWRGGIFFVTPRNVRLFDAFIEISFVRLSDQNFIQSVSMSFLCYASDSLEKKNSDLVQVKNTVKTSIINVVKRTRVRRKRANFLLTSSQNPHIEFFFSTSLESGCWQAYCTPRSSLRYKNKTLGSIEFALAR